MHVLPNDQRPEFAKHSGEARAAGAASEPKHERLAGLRTQSGGSGYADGRRERHRRASRSGAFS